MSRFTNKFNSFVVLLFIFFSCNLRENEKLNLIFDCTKPVSFSINIPEYYIDFVDWERQEWYLKKKGIDSLYSVDLPNWSKVYNLNEQICYGACKLRVILFNDTLYTTKIFCNIAPVPVKSDAYPEIFFDYTNPKLHLFQKNKLQLNMYRDSNYTNEKVIKQQEWLNKTLDNAMLKKYLIDKNLIKKP